MALWNPDSGRAPNSLEELDLSSELIHRSLFAAATDAQLCSPLESPTAPGFILWTRSNRHLREELIPLRWTMTNTSLILRTIHPSGTFAITAVSASGSVGNLLGGVRAKNPKGDAVARMIAANGTMPFVYGSPEVDHVSSHEANDMPTWFLLYKRTADAIYSELSYPIEMTNAYVDRWSTRLPVGRLEVGSGPANWGDLGAGPDVPVEEI